MIQDRSYRIALGLAVSLHVVIATLFLLDPHNEHPVLTQESKNEAGQNIVAPVEHTMETIKAVSVNSQDVMETVNRLKAEKRHEKLVEENHQRALAEQAEMARRQRVQEQEHLKKLKLEAEEIAIKQKKLLIEEKHRLAQVAEQKIKEEKRLAEMKQQQVELKKQQQHEKEHLAELKKKKEAELALAEATRQAKLKAELSQKQAAAAQQAQLDAANSARIAGVVDKYKALILGAIGRQWIVPENANKQLSSQFRIRLAPNGVVLEVSLIRSSGDSILDRSAQSAIYKASPLPVPSDISTFNLFREISLTVRPETARG